MLFETKEVLWWWSTQLRSWVVSRDKHHNTSLMVLNSVGNCEKLLSTKTFRSSRVIPATNPFHTAEWATKLFSRIISDVLQLLCSIENRKEGKWFFSPRLEDYSWQFSNSQQHVSIFSSPSNIFPSYGIFFSYFRFLWLIIHDVCSQLGGFCKPRGKLYHCVMLFLYFQW